MDLFGLGVRVMGAFMAMGLRLQDALRFVRSLLLQLGVLLLLEEQIQ
jgi:hypothetical protein